MRSVRIEIKDKAGGGFVGMARFHYESSPKEVLQEVCEKVGDFLVRHPDRRLEIEVE